MFDVLLYLHNMHSEHYGTAEASGRAKSTRSTISKTTHLSIDTAEHSRDPEKMSLGKPRFFDDIQDSRTNALNLSTPQSKAGTFLLYNWVLRFLKSATSVDDTLSRLIDR